MPAVNLIQLRAQLNKLLWNFTDPEAFRRELLELLEKFSYTAYRSGTDTLGGMTRPELQISQIVTRELNLALLPVIREQPVSAMAICDRLWNDEDISICMIGSRILGEIPIEQADMVLDRAGEYAMTGVKRLTTRALLRNASATILRTDPNILLRKVRNWYVDTDPKKHLLCIEGIAILAEDSSFENLPALYTLTEALLEEADSKSAGSLAGVLSVLLKRSPQETVYIIRNQLKTHPTVTLRRIVRKLLPEIPESSRDSIKTALRE